jgi:tetratricopeptide (TPR) repeat protein
VWEARVAGLATPVAVTLLRTAPDPRTRTGLVRDLRRASRLRSPHFATPVDVLDQPAHGAPEGTFGVVTELVRGRPLVSVSPLRGTSLLDAAATLARAFTHLHATADAGGGPLVHGALRPSSILLDEHGRLVVTDLGLRLVSGAAAQGFVPDDERGDPRADLFSLGAVIYALATESPPFGTGPESAAAIERVEARLREPEFLQPVDAAVRGLGEVVRRCLHDQASERFASTADLAAALEALYGNATDGRSLAALARPLGATPAPSQSGRLSDPRSVAQVAHPAAATARAARIEAAVQRLRGGARFLFVDGPTGSGRSAFVAEVVRRLARELPGGVRWVDAARCQTGDDLASAVCDAAGATPDPTGGLQRAGRLLARRGRMALVLDGVDALGGGLAATVHGWIAVAPELVVVCTGSTPPPGTERVALEPLGRDDAAATWVAARGFRPEDDPVELQALTELLEGRVLALEVLARCPEPPSVAAAVRRVRDRLGLSPADEPDRALRAALDVAAAALPDWARAALHQVAVFEGAFSVAQVAGAVELSPWPEAPFAVLPVTLLVERGFLTRDRQRDPAGEHLVPPRTQRWRVHDAVRAWTSARASSLDLELTRLRHRALQSELGHGDVERVVGSGAAHWRRADLLAEQWDLVAALERATEDDDGPQAARLLVALDVVAGDHLPAARMWELAREVCDLPLEGGDRVAAEPIAARAAERIGRVAEGSRRRQVALVAAAECGDTGAELRLVDADDPSVVASALRQARRGEPRLLGRLALRYGTLLDPGHRTDTRSVLEEAVRAAERGQDPATAARAGHRLGLLLADQRDGDAATERFHVAIAAWHHLGEPHRAAHVEADLGAVSLDLGRPDAALRHLVSAATASRLDGELGREAAVVARMGEVSAWCGRFDGALRHLDDAQRLQRRTDDVAGLARTLGLLGLVHTDTGRLRDARDAFDEALALGETRWRAELQLGRLGVAMAEGKADRARETLLQCLADGRAAGDPVLTGRSLALLGRASFREGHPDTARTQLEGAVQQLSGRALGWWALAELELANVLDAQGEGRVALDLLERAIAGVQAAGFVPTFALALCARARLHLRNGRTAEAAPDIAEARAATRSYQLGARAPLARALESLK